MVPSSRKRKASRSPCSSARSRSRSTSVCISSGPRWVEARPPAERRGRADSKAPGTGGLILGDDGGPEGESPAEGGEPDLPRESAAVGQLGQAEGDARRRRITTNLDVVINLGGVQPQLIPQLVDHRGAALVRDDEFE